MADPAAAPASASAGDDDLREESGYTLRMDKVAKYYDAMRNVRVAVNAMPADQRGNSINASNASLDEYAAHLEGNAPVRAAIVKAGLSPIEFMVLRIAMVQAGMASVALAMSPNDNDDSLAREMKVNPANIRFIRENEEELKAKSAKMEAEIKALESR